MAKSIRAIVFDLGGVVFDYHPQRRLAAFAGLTGLAERTVQKRLIDSGYSQSCDAGRLTPARAHAEAQRLMQLKIGYERFCRLWVSVFVPNNSVVEIARQLKGEYALALLTNNSSIVKNTLNELYPDVMSLFRPQVFSADVGQLKPHPASYIAVQKLLSMDPGDILLVDDSPQNVAGALALGLQAIHFENPPQLTETLRCLPSL